MALSPLLPIPPVIAALIVRIDRRIVQDLRTAAAVPQEAAIPLPGSRLREVRLRRLVRAGAVAEAAPGRYYLHEAGWEAHRRRRRRRVLGILAVLGALLVLAFVLA